MTHTINTPQEARAILIAWHAAPPTYEDAKALCGQLQALRNAAHTAKNWPAYTAWDVEYDFAEKAMFRLQPPPQPRTYGRCHMCKCQLDASDVASTGRNDLCHNCA